MKKWLYIPIFVYIETKLLKCYLNEIRNGMSPTNDKDKNEQEINRDEERESVDSFDVYYKHFGWIST